MSNIEVEARALLSLDQRQEVLAYMQNLGQLQEIARVSIDFSGENRTHSIALRVNDGRRELVAKTGGLADSVRREAPIKIDPQTTVEQALSCLAIMGHTQAMVSLRRMFVVRTNTLEYSVRDVLDQTSHQRVATLLDIEALNVAAGAEETAITKVYAACNALHLTPLTKQAWKAWVAEIYQNVDVPFENNPTNAAALVRSIAWFTF
jgi:hypothetical protein